MATLKVIFDIFYFLRLRSQRLHDKKRQVKIMPVTTEEETDTRPTTPMEHETFNATQELPKPFISLKIRRHRNLAMMQGPEVPPLAPENVGAKNIFQKVTVVKHARRWL